MTPQEKDNLFYLCTLIEFVGRKTKNHRSSVVKFLGKEGIEKQLYDAEVNHCLSFEQVSDEVIETYSIIEGDFDKITDCEYSIPSVTSIGKLYARLIMYYVKNDNVVDEVYNVFSSFISDEISDFRTGIYYENMSYLQCSYENGCLLD